MGKKNKNKDIKHNHDKKDDDDDDDKKQNIPTNSNINDDFQGDSSYSNDDDDDDDSVSSEEEGEDLILEGVLIRNPDVSSSDDDSDDNDNDNTHNEKDESQSKKEHNDNESNHPKSKKQKLNLPSKNATTKTQAKNNNKNNTKKSKRDNEPEIIDVEFTFNDMDEKFFHGLKTHLLSQIAYAPFSSSLADLMIENISVGTVVSTSDGEDNVYGFASVLNVTSYNDQQCIQDLKQLCLKNCPNAHRSDVETVLSGKTKRPAGFFIHGRMVNLPLEITLVLHEQLVLDMDWAVKHADGGEEERKSLDFGAFVLLAPCYLDSTTKQIVYNNFDDEIFAGCAEFTYTMELKKTSFFDSNNGNGNGKESSLVNVIVLTKTGHREGMKELKKLVAG